MTKTCNRCGDDIEEPAPKNADYVIANDICEKETQETFYGMKHTNETWKLLEKASLEFDEKDKQALSAEMANPKADNLREVNDGNKIIEHEDGTTVETAKSKEVEFSIPVEKFEHIEVESPNVVQNDENISYTYSVIEKREVTKTGLICPNCTKNTDEVIWGISN